MLTAGQGAVVSPVMRLVATSPGACRRLAYIAMARGAAGVSMGSGEAVPSDRVAGVRARPACRSVDTALVMTVLVSTLAFVFGCALVALLRPALQRRSCPPGEHLV